MSQVCRRTVTRFLVTSIVAVSGGLAADALIVPAAHAATATASSARLGDRPLRQGDKGKDVKQLQILLRKTGLKVATDGVFGAGTTKAVQRFQRAAHIEASGVVGRVTVKQLRQAVTGGGASLAAGGYDAAGNQRTHSLGDRIPVKRGMSGHDIKVLQDFLTRAGFRTTIDGEFGEGTYKAVTKFETKNGLPDDGIVDANDIDVLRGQVGAGPNAPAAEKPLELAPGDRAKVGKDGLAIAPMNAPDSVKAMIAAGNKIAFKPYIYGGGHGKWEDKGYDCSGSVSYALHGAGLLDASMPSGDFTSWGDAGPGQWVTIYANSGHMFMYVAGLRFDTSGMRSDDGTRWHASTRPTNGYTVRHPDGL